MKPYRTMLALCAMVIAAMTAHTGHAAVIIANPGGTPVIVPPSNLAGVQGPITFGPGITFTSSSPTAVFGWTGALTQYQAFPWLGTPAIGLNNSEATFTLTFAVPVKAFFGQISWGRTGYAGFSNRMSAYGINGQQLDAIDFMANGVQQYQPRGYYGFAYSSPQIRSIVFTNDYMAVRNMTVLAGSAVPEPSAWALMLIGFALIGAAIRRRSRAAALWR